MPVEIRRRRQISLDAIAKICSNSELSDVHPGSVTLQIADSWGTTSEEIYFQLQRLKEIWSIETATGTDLDERAADYSPYDISRRTEIRATGYVKFSRTVATAQAVYIPLGTQVRKLATTSTPEIVFETTQLGVIAASALDSSYVPIRAIEYGTIGNVSQSTIISFVTGNPSGVNSVTNDSATTGGQDREDDASFRSRIVAHIRSLTRGTDTALINAAFEAVVDTTGQRCDLVGINQRISEPGVVDMYIDDGAGTAESTTVVTAGSPETLITSYLNETIVRTAHWPIKENTETVYYNGVAKIRNIHYYIDHATGKIEFGILPTVADPVTIAYTYYTGLVALVQKIINGDETDRTNYPGYKSAGDKVLVKVPTIISINVACELTILAGYSADTVRANVVTAIENHINSLSMGDDIVWARMLEIIMSIDGVYNATLTNPASDRYINVSELARAGTVTAT